MDVWYVVGATCALCCLCGCIATVLFHRKQSDTEDEDDPSKPEASQIERRSHRPSNIPLGSSQRTSMTFDDSNPMAGSSYEMKEMSEIKLEEADDEHNVSEEDAPELDEHDTVLALQVINQLDTTLTAGEIERGSQELLGFQEENEDAPRLSGTAEMPASEETMAEGNEDTRRLSGTAQALAFEEKLADDAPADEIEDGCVTQQGESQVSRRMKRIARQRAMKAREKSAESKHVHRVKHH